MNSKIALIACAVAATQAISLNSEQQSAGIFGAMIEQATAGETLAQQRAEAKERKRKQLEEAEKEYQKNVAEEEREEAAKLKKE